MRICLDVDGTLCELKSQGDHYATVRPLPHAAESIRALRAAGHYIILATARMHDALLWTQDEHFQNLPGVRYFPTSRN